GNDPEDIQLKARLLELLMILPIPSRTMLTDNKVYEIVERWAQKDSPESSQYINPPSTDTNKGSGADDDTKSENVEKKLPKELVKYAGKLVIKSKSKALTEKSLPSSESNLTVGQLAQRVLIHWKDLKD